MRACLVGATHPCHNPRLVREADSLVALGWEVTVVAVGHMSSLVRQDDRLLATRGWRLRRFDSFDGRFRPVALRAWRQLARSAFRASGGRVLASHAYTPAFAQLRRMAEDEPVDWIIAHAHPALPVAAAAARHWGARLGFDCEDLLALTPTEPVRLIRAIEEAHIRLCDYVSVPSEAMADRLRQDYPELRTATLYNVFPLKLAEGMTAPERRVAGPRLKLHWFSQTVGGGRGLEDALEASVLLSAHVELHLRGHVTPSFAQVLERYALRGARIHLHPYAHHDTLIKTLEQFDVGLALEPSAYGNGALTASNKLFSYMLAGLAVAASDTVGQSEILSKNRGAGFLYPSGQPQVLAERLGSWIESRNELRLAQNAAWNAAREEYSWDVQQKRFIDVINEVDLKRESTSNR